MLNNSNQEETDKISEESVVGEESMNLNDTEMDSDSHEGSAHDDTMSVNEVIAPTCSEKTKENC